MRIVEVRFIKDSQSVQTGNEFYPSGASAHFYEHQANALVAEGRAVLSNESPPVVENSQPPAPNYDDMTVKELRVITKRHGLTIAGKRKAELITALKEYKDG